MYKRQTKNVEKAALPCPTCKSISANPPHAQSPEPEVEVDEPSVFSPEPEVDFELVVAKGNKGGGKQQRRSHFPKASEAKAKAKATTKGNNKGNGKDKGKAKSGKDKEK